MSYSLEMTLVLCITSLHRHLLADGMNKILSPSGKVSPDVYVLRCHAFVGKEEKYKQEYGYK